MMNFVQNRSLILGDIAVLAGVTIAGFSTHGTLTSAGMRMLTTFIPLLAAWLLIAPHLGVFDRERAADPYQLWRPFWAMVLAAPLAAWLRAVILGSMVSTIFVVVLGGVSALSLLAWRAGYCWVARRKTLSHG